MPNGDSDVLHPEDRVKDKLPEEYGVKEGDVRIGSELRVFPFSQMICILIDLFFTATKLSQNVAIIEKCKKYFFSPHSPVILQDFFSSHKQKS